MGRGRSSTREQPVANAAGDERAPRRSAWRLWEVAASLAVGVLCVAVLVWMDKVSLARTGHDSAVAAVLLRPGVVLIAVPLMLLGADILRHGLVVEIGGSTLDVLLFALACYALFWLRRFGRDDGRG